MSTVDKRPSSDKKQGAAVRGEEKRNELKNMFTTPKQLGQRSFLKLNMPVVFYFSMGGGASRKRRKVYLLGVLDSSRRTGKVAI